MSGSRNGWVTVTPFTDPMRPTLVERAKKRKVYAGKREETWVVEGNPALGDNYDSYLVSLQDDGHYVCDCHSHQHGGSRKRKTCSHVTAAILFQQTPQLEIPTEPDHQLDSPDPSREEGDTPISPSSRGDKTPSPLPAKTLPFAQGVEQFNGEGVSPNPQNISLADEPPMPAKFVKYGANQWDAIEAIIEGYKNGAKVIMLDAPTGSGKTVLAESVRRLLGVRAIYTCTTHILQEQVMRDFGDYAREIKGRANYPTLDDPSWPQLTADDCTKKKASLPACSNCPGWSDRNAWGSSDGPEAMHCRNCHPWYLCPYEVAKQEAAFSRLAVLNTAYFLSETTFVRRSNFRGWPLVILDEADELESQLMNFVEVSISPRLRKALDIGLPKKKTVDEAWVEWLVGEVMPSISRRKKELGSTPDLLGINEVNAVREKKGLDRLEQSIEWLLAPAPVADDALPDPDALPVLQTGWVYTGYEDIKTESRATVTFKPVRVNQFGNFLWSKADKFLLMSATLVSPEQTAEDLGIPEDEWAVVSMPSTFPVARRPISPVAATSVTRKNEDAAYPILVTEIIKILDQYPHDRVLVHTVSYKLTKYLHLALRQSDHRNRIFSYLSKRERQFALDRYLNSRNGVILAPSLDRGVDFRDDSCRVIIVAKVPWPSLGDKQVSTRLHSTGRSGEIWYACQAIRTLCQMTGRGMRSAEDWCHSFILDEEFVRLHNRWRKLFPAWWREAVIWSTSDPKWKEVREIAASTKRLDNTLPEITIASSIAEEEERLPVPF